MASWASRIFQHKARKSIRRPIPSFRPRLEVLEDRVVPALTYHGGLILSSVQAQAVYLGADWAVPNSALLAQTSQFNAFLAATASGSYLNMLGADGFTGPNTVGGLKVAVGAGSFLGGVTDSPATALQYTNLSGYNNSNPLSSSAYVQSVLFDSQIQADLSAEINGKAVNAANSNTLYVVFVEPNVVVDFGNGQNSINAFGAYHSSFALNGNGPSVRYAVVPYAGSNGFLNNTSGYANSQVPYLSSFDSMTMVTTHETAEAATDPDLNAWYDSSGNEIGDIVNGVTVYLNGYAVQRESAIPGSEADFLAMTPSGATASHSATFSIDTNGLLKVTESGGPSFDVADPAAATGHAEKGHVVSISAPGIDDFGQPMVDVLFSDGYAYEYHDFLSPTATTKGNPGFFPWTSLGGNVKQAVAGQGVSYVLLTNGSLGEYVDPNYATYSYGYGVNPGSNRGAIVSGVTSITAAGVDQVGVNAVEYVKSGKTYEWRDVAAQSSSSTSGFTANGAKKVAGHSSMTSDLEAAQAALLTADPVAVVTPFPVGSGSVSTSLHTNPAVLTVTTPTFPAPFNRVVDGGGSDSRLIDGQDADGSTVLTPSDSPVNLGDVPVFGPIFTEAVRQLKETRSMLPSGFLHVAPANPAPAPTGGPKGTPESKAPEAGKARTVAVSGLLAVFVLGFLGLTRDDRRRRRQPGL